MVRGWCSERTGVRYRRDGRIEHLRATSELDSDVAPGPVQTRVSTYCSTPRISVGVALSPTMIGSLPNVYDAACSTSSCTRIMSRNPRTTTYAPNPARNVWYLLFEPIYLPSRRSFDGVHTCALPRQSESRPRHLVGVRTDSRESYDEVIGY